MPPQNPAGQGSNPSVSASDLIKMRLSAHFLFLPTNLPTNNFYFSPKSGKMLKIELVREISKLVNHQFLTIWWHMDRMKFVFAVVLWSPLCQSRSAARSTNLPGEIFNAFANRRIRTKLGMCSPRSIFPM